ncbi:MAG TPA: DUF2007 domain-containing protein [Longimicrobiales bacterium]|nr:DUF2007 domain-containing protein [Longimicrobiales bacterium]
MTEYHDTAEVARFNRRHEAETAQGFLADAGIGSMISADDGGGMDLGLSLTRSARLLVRSEDEASARLVLEDAGLIDDEEDGDAD